ncbi:YebC/PmpR family DNA-binding regulatory protein [Roseimicrobium gellanilyticum]|jgi:YebC/PmpR family DNA-binding regulatory protein|uniref:YebC/PmpR family DNA-binding regulatory protein n=1 Tax=Roseimicrobium gellanilyticum TaxID=748857 RepID=A0A366HUS6_9BACT|nr:YebC/PmpR family DNA-binding transcriptional regulator [Roseimicrobium gellanilyticum]RBP47284.1 YebC/PmpR family DNA-binding regulatory protein [Roseimicrobium gellanilyticum]
MGAQWKQKWRELAADQKGKIVGKLTREIQVATKLGGPNPEFNARLAAAIAVAKKQSVTRDTIERAIAKGSGTGADAVQYHTVVYEGFTPHRVPVIVECLTDNNNRTSTEIKMLFKAGNLGTPGSVGWMFEHCGLVEAHHPDTSTDIETAALEADADNVEPLELDDEELAHHIGARFFCPTTKLDAVTKALKSAGWIVTTSELHYHPKECPPLTDAQREEVTNFLQSLDGHADVHRVYAAIA